MNKNLQAIELHLQTFGGKQLYIECKSDAYYILKNYDSFISAKEIALPVRLVQMKEHNCHGNCIVYRKNHKNAIVYIGFGLDSVGDWLLHSCCVEKINGISYIIETTHVMQKYVGNLRKDNHITIEMSKEEVKK